MRDLITSLSDRAEFILVLLIGFGYATFASLALFLSSGGLQVPDQGIPVSDVSAYSTIIYELLMLWVISRILKLRDWSIKDFNVQISLRLTLAGLLLGAIYYTVYLALFSLSSSFFDIIKETAATFQINNDNLNVIAAIALSAVNAFFEEILVVGYVVGALKEKRGITVAINVSVLIRFSYHLYQGPLAVIGIIPLGLLFAYVYARWGRLWPLIFAHGLIDAMVLTGYPGP